MTAIMGRLKSMIQDVTAPAMTRDEVLTTIERRLTAGKALNEYMGQDPGPAQEGMTGVDIGNVDDGLYLVEAKIKAGAEAQTENAYMHRIMGRVKAKVGAPAPEPAGEDHGRVPGAGRGPGGNTPSSGPVP